MTTTEIISNTDDRESVAVTVYNDDFALVKEVRRLDLPRGQVELRLRDVSAQMQAETAALVATSGDPVTLYEQNFDFDLLSPENMLQKYVGHAVTVIKSHPTTGEETRESATVLANNGGIVLRFDDRIETGVPGRLAFDSVPANLRDRPTLSVVIEAAGGTQSLELSYLTSGMAWQADYVANLSENGSSMTLSGWVTLTNRSGAAYQNATLQLVAGKVNRVRRLSHTLERGAPVFASAAAGGAAPQQEQLLDFHLYTYDRKTTVADNQVKQLALLSTEEIPVRRYYSLRGHAGVYRGRLDGSTTKSKPSVYIEFDNKGPGLDKPLPAGIVRTYTKDSRGGAQFVGEDRIDHTAKGEVVKLRLGEAFDITIERKQTDCTTIGERGAQTSHHAEFRNAKDSPVTVKLEEPMPGEWHVVRSSLPHVKETGALASWLVDVPANGSTVLEYTIRAKW